MTRRGSSHRPTRPAAGAGLLSDARLARQAAGGDERAFAAIYRRYHQRLYRFCISILSRPEDAQEALQNTMVKALRSLPGEEREIQLKPWLYRIAHNESVELLRKRREEVEFDPELVTTADGLAETAALRERLRRLFTDLTELPERQRAALTMREMGGLGFEQIGEALDTSGAVARQAIYEARINLRRMEAGREMGCKQVMPQLSDADGRVTRRRDIQAHLRACPDCREFRDAIESRQRDLAAIAPLPAFAAGAILKGLVGGQAGTGSLAGGAIGAGVGETVATSAAVKAMATVAVATTIGVTAADRGGLMDVPLPASSGERAKAIEAPATKVEPTAATGKSRATPDQRFNQARQTTGQPQLGSTPASEPGAAIREEVRRAPSSSPTLTNLGNDVPGPPVSLPQASQHGQETAAGHKSEGGSSQGQENGRRAQGANETSNPGRGESKKGGAEPEKKPPPELPSQVQSNPGNGSPPGPPSAVAGEAPGHTNGHKAHPKSETLPD